MTTRTMFGRFTCVAVIAIMSSGCATTGRQTAHDQATTQSESATRPPANDGAVTPLPNRQSDVLTAGEFGTYPGLVTAHDVIERFRPWFLHARDNRTGGSGLRALRPAVFVDGAFHGDINVLRTIPMSEIREIQLLRTLEAVHRFGPEYQGGVIVVRSRR